MTWVTLVNDTTINASDLNGNFYHVAQGNFLPMGAASMSYTTGAYTLGTTGNRWRTAYVNEIAGNTVTVSAVQQFNGQVTFSGSISVSFAAGFLGYYPRVYAAEIQPTGTAAGAGTAGAYYKRGYNTSTINIAGASMTASQIALPAGTYVCQAWAAGFDCGAMKLRLYNVSDASTIETGLGNYSYGGGSDKCFLFSWPFTLTAEKTVELQMRKDTATGPNSLGYPNGNQFLTQIKELYSELEIIKIA